MAWINEIDDGEQQSINEMNAKGLGKAPKQKKEVGLFDGAASAIPRGLVAGAVKVADTVSKPFERVADHLQYSIDDVQNGGLDGALDVREPSFSDVHKAKNKDRRDALVLEIEQLQDAQNTGTAGNILFSLSDYGVRALGGGLIAGPVGAAALTGASETNYSRDELIHKGVDESTATKAALIDGGIAAVSTALPLSYGLKGTGGLAADAAISVGGATALSQGGQFASGELLKSEGYDKQAKKYEVTGESIATDALLNTLFFGAARGAAHYANRSAAQIEADTTKQQAALVLNELEYDEISAPVQPSNAVQANNHLKNLDSATDDIRAGRPVRVQHPVAGEEKKKPVNYEAMPIPTNAKAIARKAQQEGINPSVALTISHIETGGKFDHTAKNPTSTAHGLFQVLDKTWKGQGGGDRNNVDEQIKQGLKHIRNANASLRKSLGRDPVAHEQYLGHLLGPAGASKVLKADQNAKLIDIVRTYDAKNADAIVNNNGMAGLTVGQAITKWQGKWNQLSARYGGNGTSTAIGMNGSSYDMAYEVKSLGDLIASNDLAYGVNPLYPGELQPRDRTREASRQQIENMANDLRPELLGESSMLSNGAPIIGMDNVVESGNGRTLAITKAYEAGKADDYRAFIEQYAQEKGWDISGVDRPVLVRTRLTDTDRVQFSRLANEADVAQFSASERAVTDIDRLPDSSLLKINNDGTLNIDGSMDFVRGFVDQLPQSERSAAIMPDGRLSQEGKRRIESALVQRAYGDSNLVTRLAEALDDDSKTVLNALLRMAPQLAQLGDLVKQGGRHQNTIAEDLAQAAQKLSDLKANGQTVPDYLNQNLLLDDGLSDGAKQFLNVFDSNKRSAKAISDNIQSEIARIEGMGDPRQGSLFGDGPEESAALDVILRNPDMPFPNGKIDSDGNPEMYTVKEYWAELEAEAKQAQQDILAAQIAVNCALQFG
ncbi:lytic transglycosylase domain-containing protein [Acinetobacter sp. WCHAc060007]|uniref:lytic transglycosylase domain-containing protein n=1 Tax=Acinetobacter sp. WCHAc060007 TaxID=2419605 RepID=UPI000EA00FDF|nr:lytic transglycosylase domain-containing protein [Acinetobacter sp. WCHAc060007]RKG44863.1 lytic transglycosylase domain-containing protein [Acinetobacter sp. WCHAc060007]